MKLRNTLASVLTIGLLATSAASAAAQSEESPSGTFFTGVVSFEEADGEGWQHGILEDATCGPNDEPAGIVVNDISWGALIEASDPRISGTMEEAYSTLDCIVDGESVASAFWVEYRITNDEGSWTGGGPGYIARELEWEDPRSLAFYHTMTGEGAYEGLTATFLRQRNAWNEDGPPTHAVNGVIVAGDIPPASDFDGSVEAREGLIPDPRYDFEEEPEGNETIELPEALSPVGQALAEAAASFDGVDPSIEPWGTLGDFIESDPDDDGMAQMQAKMEEALAAIGIDGHSVQNYGMTLGRETDDTIDWLFQGVVEVFEGADPDTLAEVMHPDSDPYILGQDAPADTVAEELSYGGKTVFRHWNQGEAMYIYIDGDQVLVINPPADEAAVDAFLTALIGPAD